MRIQLSLNVRGYGIVDERKDIVEWVLQDCNKLLCNQWDNIPKHRQRKLLHIIKMRPEDIQNETDVACTLSLADD